VKASFVLYGAQRPPRLPERQTASVDRDDIPLVIELRGVPRATHETLIEPGGIVEIHGVPARVAILVPTSRIQRPTAIPGRKNRPYPVE